MSNYSREVSLNISLSLVNDSAYPWKSDYDGYIGIKPWQHDPEQNSSNFVHQLRVSGIIDYEVVMVNAMN